MRRRNRRLALTVLGALVVLMAIGFGARVHFQGRYHRAFASPEGNQFEALIAIVADFFIPNDFVAKEEEIESARRVASNNRGRLLRLTRLLEDPIAIPDDELVGSSSMVRVPRVGQVYLAAALSARANGNHYDAVRSRLELLEFASAANRGGLLMHAMLRQKLEDQALRGLDLWLRELSQEEKQTLGGEFARILRWREPYEDFIRRETLWARRQMRFGKNPVAWLKQKRELGNLYADSRERFEAFEPMVYDIEAAFGIVGE